VGQGAKPASLTFGHFFYKNVQKAFSFFAASGGKEAESFLYIFIEKVAKS